MISQVALIALGSNETSRWGDALATVKEAATRISRFAEGTCLCSAFYATPAVPAGSGPEFVNAAMAITVTQSAQSLLAALHKIEAAAHRTRTVRWGQRTLDLDLLAYGQMIAPDRDTYMQWRGLKLDQQVARTPTDLILPHPRLQDRAFVLMPLNDVAPDWCHPVLGRSVAQMLRDLDPGDRAMIRKIAAAP